MVSESPTSGKKVLLVEDDPFLMKMYQDKFVIEGIDLDVAEDGKQGLEKALSGEYDLVILDLMIPQIPGLELLGRLRQDDKGQRLPVIVLTNLTDDSQKSQAKNYGVREYLVKAELTPSQLAEKVKSILTSID